MQDLKLGADRGIKAEAGQQHKPWRQATSKALLLCSLALIIQACATPTSSPAPVVESMPQAQRVPPAAPPPPPQASPGTEVITQPIGGGARTIRSPIPDADAGLVQERPGQEPIATSSPSRELAPAPVPTPDQSQPSVEPTLTVLRQPMPALLNEPPMAGAARALAEQARQQSQDRDFEGAAATLERALRIEADHPLLWLEMARVRLAQGNYPQAESMARKALSTANGHRPAQAAAWQMLANSLRGMDREAEAQQADQQAMALQR